MVTNFEEQTERLNDIEMAAIPIFKKCFEEGHVGARNRISAREICEKMASLPQFRKSDGRPLLTDVRVRKIINYIRMNDIIPMLCGDNRGYYVAETEQEVRDFIRSMRDRTSSMILVTDRVEKQYKRLYPNATPIKTQYDIWRR